MTPITVNGVECVKVTDGELSVEEVTNMANDLFGSTSICSFCPRAENLYPCTDWVLEDICSGAMIIEAKYVPMLIMRGVKINGNQDS